MCVSVSVSYYQHLLSHCSYWLIMFSFLPVFFSSTWTISIWDVTIACFFHIQSQSNFNKSVDNFICWSLFFSGFIWRDPGFWFSSHSFVGVLWWYYMKWIFHVCPLVCSVFCLLSFSVYPSSSHIHTHILQWSLLSGSVQLHKLLPQHMKETRNQRPSTVHATVWMEYTLS